MKKFILQSHACEPVWRPTTRDEIQAGWMIRSRNGEGFETNWGVAHHQDEDGDWRTEEGGALTFTRFGWTYETTAPEPEPKPDPRLSLLEGVCLREGVVLTRPEAALLLSIADAAAVKVVDVLRPVTTDELAHMTEARDNARAEVERLTGQIEAAKRIGLTHLGRAWADVLNDVLRALSATPTEDRK